MPIISEAVTGSNINSVSRHRDHHTAQTAVTAAGNSGAAKTLTLDNVAHITVTLTANCTFTFTLDADVGTATYHEFTLALTQDGTGSRTATWPASVVWPAATAPTLTATAARTDLLKFRTWDAGTKWLGESVALDYTLA